MQYTRVISHKPNNAEGDPHQGKLEQLERLHSEDTSRNPMITHIIDSYWIPSQNKTKSKLQI